jgi:hypothetical protein
MIEKIKCQNNHKMVICWEGGYICDRKCTNVATKYTVDNFGMFYLCDECYKDDCKRRMDSEYMSIANEDN